jgi:ABC-type methionine transport system permease subunit
LGHASYFGNRSASDWLGRALGVITLTPYDVWRRTHAIHHAHHGNLSHRGIGDVLTLTVEEYRARSRWGRMMYRLYRHPLVLFVLGPSYLFILQNRLPVGLMASGWRYWVSAMGTNAFIVMIVSLILWLDGLMPLLLIYILGGGPVPAMIAIAFHTTGALGKMFSEVAENADQKPVEGLTSVGATWGQKMWLGVIPQVAPDWLSYVLQRFEVNVRASAILGFVGSGGIGYDLKIAMQWGGGKYDQVVAIFLMLFLTIVLIDQLSSRYRQKLVKGS